jgi:hypothetical protein
MRSTASKAFQLMGTLKVERCQSQPLRQTRDNSVAARHLQSMANADFPRCETTTGQDAHERHCDTPSSGARGFVAGQTGDVMVVARRRAQWLVAHPMSHVAARGDNRRPGTSTCPNGWSLSAQA